jgi:PAS domain S-box-containing protein
MILTAILVALCLVSAVITYGLGIYVFSKNPASLTNRLFLAAMLTGTYWAFGEFMLWNAPNYEGVLFWLRASALWPFAIAFSFHFVLVITGHAIAKEKNLPYLLLFIYLPALAITIAGILSDSLFTVGYVPGTGYTYLPAENSLVHFAESIYFLIVMIASLSAGVASFFRAQTDQSRRQSGLLTAGILVLIVFGSLSGIILPAFGIVAPNLVFVGIIVFSIIITYAIFRHDLFTLSPASVVSDIIRMMPDGIVLVSMDDRIVTVNAAAAAITGQDMQSLPGTAAGTALTEPVYRSIRSAVIADGSVPDLEATFPHNNKAVVSIAASLVKDPNGEPAGILMILRDITGRKAQEEALHAANFKISLLNQLTRHDISNLVTALSSYLALLSQKNLDEAARDRYTASCNDIVARIARHLEFSREYQDIGAHDPVWQPLEAMVSRAISDLDAQGVEIITRVAPVELFTDPLTSKVIYNLFENALRHGGHATRIQLSSAGQPDGTLAFIVEDNGNGVKDEEKELIFHRGFGKNTGLGLTLSRDILAVTGITITENGVFGKGARFEIRIPPAAWRPPAGKNPADVSGTGR